MCVNNLPRVVTGSGVPKQHIKQTKLSVSNFLRWPVHSSDVNKDLTFKDQDKDQTLKAKDQDKD